MIACDNEDGCPYEWVCTTPPLRFLQRLTIFHSSIWPVSDLSRQRPKNGTAMLAYELTDLRSRLRLHRHHQPQQGKAEGNERVSLFSYDFFLLRWIRHPTLYSPLPMIYIDFPLVIITIFRVCVLFIVGLVSGFIPYKLLVVFQNSQSVSFLFNVLTELDSSIDGSPYV